MDFIVGLPNTSRHHDSIWVIVDRLTKTAHFLPVHTTHRMEKYAEIYIDQIVRLHGIPRTIVSDRGAPFVARFWEQLQESLGTHVIRSSAYHPQTDGQTERVNQILEDMLMACVLHYGKDWDKCLPLADVGTTLRRRRSCRKKQLRLRLLVRDVEGIIHEVSVL
jgi:transposase InsO family protein